MPDVFEKTTLAGIPLNNRILRSATCEALADEEGRPTEALEHLYVNLARGGVGAIITGLTGVQPDGKAFRNASMFHRDDYISDYQRLVNQVHQHQTPIILQVCHAGRQTSSAVSGHKPVSPSSRRDKLFFLEAPRKLDENAIQALINSFVDTIARAQEAGFDGVQIHAAHGYMLSQFLTPYINTRRDRWGGNTENRFRIVAEIMEKARKRVGDFPILAKINSDDGNRNGTDLSEAIRIAMLLEAHGVDAVEVSCGVAEDMFHIVRVHDKPVKAFFELVPEVSRLPGPVKAMAAVPAPLFVKTFRPVDNYNVTAAESIRAQVGIPVIVVGGIKRLADIEDIIGNARADYVSMSRAFVNDPAIVNKFQSGEARESSCISCGYCVLGINGAPLKCYYGKL